MTERDDEAWRAIVENYGERPALGDAPEARAGSEQDASPLPAEPGQEPPTGVPDQPAEPDATIARAPAEEEGFVPPPAPPLPYVAPPRLAAGLGTFGAPLVLLVCVVAGIAVPSWLGYLLVAGFVGGFAYLVAHMKKRPDDPWDDGARV